MDVDLDKEVMAIAENHPYLALVVGGPSAEVFFVVERCVFESLSKVSSIMVVLMQATSPSTWHIQSHFILFVYFCNTLCLALRTNKLFQTLLLDYCHLWTR